MPFFTLMTSTLNSRSKFILFHRLFASCDENREEIPFIYPYYLKLVCDSLLDKYHQYSARSYAMKYMDDVVDYIYQWLDCIARKGIISYTYDLVKILVQIHKEKTKHIYTLESVQQLIKAFFYKFYSQWDYLLMFIFSCSNSDRF